MPVSKSGIVLKLGISSRFPQGHTAFCSAGSDRHEFQLGSRQFQIGPLAGPTLPKVPEFSENVDGNRIATSRRCAVKMRDSNEN